jgi:hypothetical protein
MTTPFDEVIENIKKQGYHNHRLDAHSNIVSRGIYFDLIATCPEFKRDVESDKIRMWLNVPAPGGREREIDLLVGEQDSDGGPDLDRTRICVENKSVITAHRNRDARYDDLNEMIQVLYAENPLVISAATVMIGVVERFLNVPDRVKPFHNDFETRIRPRLSIGDNDLWNEFNPAVSKNRANDPKSTIEKFRMLPVKAGTGEPSMGYNYLLLVPVRIDNVNPPSLARDNNLGIDIDKDYWTMVRTLAFAYQEKWGS